eukprot:scaffold12803_cov60-Isochrysis_galbana.AAC.2
MDGMGTSSCGPVWGRRPQIDASSDEGCPSQKGACAVLSMGDSRSSLSVAKTVISTENINPPARTLAP